MATGESTTDRFRRIEERQKFLTDRETNHHARIGDLEKQGTDHEGRLDRVELALRRHGRILDGDIEQDKIGLVERQRAMQDQLTNFIAMYNQDKKEAAEKEAAKEKQAEKLAEKKDNRRWDILSAVIVFIIYQTILEPLVSAWVGK